MSQQQQDDERRRFEEDAMNAYANAMSRRDRERGLPGIRTSVLDRYYTDAKAPLPEKEQDK